MKKNNKEETFEIDTLNILDPQKICFENTNSGFMNLKYEEKSYEQVSLIRLVPFHERDKYISVSYTDSDKEWHEIGVIRDINELPEKQEEIARDYIEYRYYIPYITKIYSIKDNMMNYLFIDAETTAGRKRIAVNDWWSNFRLSENNLLSIVDADGNRYYIPHVEDLDNGSMKKLQLFI